jgi:hypothetical protein
MVSRQKERFGGLFIATMGILLTVWTWQSALSKGNFTSLGAVGGPIFAVMGLGMMVFPSYQRERIERGEDISQLSGYALITPRWWGILAIGSGLGLINYAVLKGWL